LIRVAVSGAAGRMGSTVCQAVTQAPDMEVVARADPALGTSVSEALAQRPEVLVDFTLPTTVIANAREAVAAGVHVVIGTTGFDPGELAQAGLTPRESPGGRSRTNVFAAPNFAIGAVLMMQFAQQAARHMARAEIVELHHDRKLDAPSGTAARTAALMLEAAPALGEVPVHSVRLPGLVAHHEVILGDVGQTLTIRHDSIDRQSFMPGVLLAIRRVGELTESPVVGLEKLL
jgi:4-hydroxy-tetrahydrodipicolinate reductase